MLQLLWRSPVGLVDLICDSVQVPSRQDIHARLLLHLHHLQDDTLPVSQETLDHFVLGEVVGVGQVTDTYPLVGCGRSEELHQGPDLLVELTLVLGLNLSQNLIHFPHHLLRGEYLRAVVVMASVTECAVRGLPKGRSVSHGLRHVGVGKLLLRQQCSDLRSTRDHVLRQLDRDRATDHVLHHLDLLCYP